MPTNERWVTVERVSNSGNPLSKEKVNGSNLIVYGGEPGKRYRVRILRHGNAWIGGITNPSHEEHRRAVEQRQKREHRLGKKQGRKSRRKPAKGKPSAKQMKLRIGEKRGAPGGKTGSWSFDKVPGLRKPPQPPKRDRNKKKIKASKSLQDLGRRFGSTSVTNQEKTEGPSYAGADEPSETVKELRRRAGRHQ